MAQFRQPDFSRGDPNTLGGYMAVHDRPAAFEGSDGFSYSVEILTDHDDHTARWGAYLFFVKWARIGASSPAGHLESDILEQGATEDEARQRIGALPLSEVKRVLDTLIARAPDGAPKRKWWDAMRAESTDHEDEQ
ncbi:MAG TPA: hypothetical protein VJ867_02580 [Gemmatimonadaceae bacterium]|nr:hypothetical protein [Gemmatimonadaceae bacterium]